MAQYLEFRNAKCKDCNKCLRECPVKAIDVTNHQAKIIEDRCILCGHCTLICPQNAKIVHTDLEKVKQLLESGEPVIASVAPSFISSFEQEDFSVMRLALAKLGFADAQETAVGAQVITEEYRRLLKEGNMKNFITSACPAACRLIQMYYPMALPYLAPVDSPMVAHAKIIKQQNPNAHIVFIGPCIAKKREGAECGLVDYVLTFEDLKNFFEEKNIHLDELIHIPIAEGQKGVNLSKLYPISHGIIKSIDDLPEGYEYMSVDGPDRCTDALRNIEQLDHVFIELNLCKDACVNGPCSLDYPGGSIKATSDVRNYVNREKMSLGEAPVPQFDLDFSASYPRMRNSSIPPSERDIVNILKKTGKLSKEDELDCGACGYSSCREKAWAVYNGYSDIEVCLPYMRQRAESLSFEIMQNSPEGIIVLDSDMNILEINNKGRELLNIMEHNIKGKPAYMFFNTVDFITAFNQKRHIESKGMYLRDTQKYVDLSVNFLEGQNVLFGIMQDVTEAVNYDKQIQKVKLETLATTDEVIKKQMHVAQEIASLLGETTAETKVALLKLKKTLQEEDKNK